MQPLFRRNTKILDLADHFSWRSCQNVNKDFGIKSLVVQSRDAECLNRLELCRYCWRRWIGLLVLPSPPPPRLFTCEDWHLRRMWSPARSLMLLLIPRSQKKKQMVTYQLSSSSCRLVLMSLCSLCTFFVRRHSDDTFHEFFGLHSQLDGRINERRGRVGTVIGWRWPAVAANTHTHTHRVSGYSTTSAELREFMYFTRCLRYTGWVPSALCGHSEDKPKEHIFFINVNQ